MKNKDIPYHLYIGQQVMYESKHHCILCSIGFDTIKDKNILFTIAFSGGGGVLWGIKPEDCTLILRRLDSMTEDELKEFLLQHFLHTTKDVVERVLTKVGWVKAAKGINKHRQAWYESDRGEGGLISINFQSLNADQFVWLLSRGFWLFGEEAFMEGLVIDKESLK